ncbi:CBY1-interacting BAR domain-containing protein 2-like [Menidia menidia]
MNSPLSRDVQVRSMEQTVRVAEKNMGELCCLLASYTRKTAKLRDKADQLVAQLFHFSSTEDPELQIGLKILAEDLAMVQDYRQAQVERLETRVVDPLKVYGEIIKNKRTDLKKFSTDLNREQKELQKVDKIRRRNPADRQSIVSFAFYFSFLFSFLFSVLSLHQHSVSKSGTSGGRPRSSKNVCYMLIKYVVLASVLFVSNLRLQYHFLDDNFQSQAEVIAQKASTNVQNSIRQLEETMTEFQKQKLEGIKRIFTDFITVEMLFHAKALEVFSHTYSNLEAINTQKDLEFFTARNRMTDSQDGPQDSAFGTNSPHFRNHYSASPQTPLKTQGLNSARAFTAGQSRHKEEAKRSHSNLHHQRGVEDELEQEEDDEEETDAEEQEESESDMENSGNSKRQSYASQYVQMHT